MRARRVERKASPLFEIARVLLCFDHVARLIVNANHSVMSAAKKLSVVDCDSRPAAHPPPHDRIPAAEYGSPALRHDRQRQVIASPACVAGLEVVAIAGKDRAVGKVTERAENRIGRCVVNDSEN